MAPLNKGVFFQTGFLRCEKSDIGLLACFAVGFFRFGALRLVVSEAFQVPFLALSTLYGCFRML